MAVADPEVELRDRMALVRGPGRPVFRPAVILPDAPAGIVQQPQPVLGLGDALLRRLLVPERGAGRVPRRAPAVFVTAAERALRPGVAASRPPQQAAELPAARRKPRQPEQAVRGEAELLPRPAVPALHTQAVPPADFFRRPAPAGGQLPVQPLPERKGKQMEFPAEPPAGIVVENRPQKAAVPEDPVPEVRFHRLQNLNDGTVHDFSLTLEKKPIRRTAGGREGRPRRSGPRRKGRPRSPAASSRAGMPPARGGSGEASVRQKRRLLFG